MEQDRGGVGCRARKQGLGLSIKILAFCVVSLCLRAQTSGVQVAPDTRVLAAPEDVNAPPSDSQSTPSGLRIKVLVEGTGFEHPVGQDCVEVKFAAWKRDGSLQSSSGVHGEAVVQCLSRTVAGVAEALRLMVPGEKTRVWVPGKLTFVHVAHWHAQKEEVEERAPDDDLTFDVELVRILKVPTTPEDLKKPPASATKTASGVALQVLEEGTGNVHPSASSRVSLHYSAWTAEGKLFESTVTAGHPGTFLMGSLLPGWREGLQNMVVGEKTRIWIPAALAYGEKPASRKVPAGDLVLDVQLLAIE